LTIIDSNQAAPASASHRPYDQTPLKPLAEREGWARRYADVSLPL